MGIEEQYRILPFDEKDPLDSCPVMIMRHDEYDGVVYKYGKVSIDPQGEEEAYLSFTYEVQENPDGANTESLEFKNFIGDVLVNIIEHNMEESETDGDGSSHTVESTEE